MNWLTTFLALSLVTTLYAVNPYDPGPCTEEKRGKFVVVKDRNDDDQIVACLQRRGKYQWDMINGHSYGNYFDPAKDCSHVVDNVPKAKNGVYWIQTGNRLQKGWCDVETDKGGFLLIGVQNTPKTWFIPFHSSVVYPHGLPGWSSAFGDENVSDFRIQISTSKDFNDTRAHWYYRFNSPRILSKLLMSDEGGCDKEYPGIGNIAYVKDLMSRKITTTNFKCSRFGTYIAPGFGWEQMNKCFKETCPNGFAYLGMHHIDTCGSFSYSVVNEDSGIRDTQTSFIGCVHEECCACFGPDSKQDYCEAKCQAINGGKVLKEKDNITVWFWIRSSLPKRVWKQCTEFKDKNSEGKLETWRIEDGVKRKGSCSVPEDVTIIDGVAVVSNNQSINELPKVEGQLSYRTDDRKLYLNENSQWKALATQEDIKDVLGKLDKVEKKLTSADKSTLDQLNKVNKTLTDADKATFDKLDKVEKKLTDTDKSTLDQLSKINRTLTDADKATLGKLDKVEKTLTDADKSTLDQLNKVNKTLTDADKATLGKLDKVEKELTDADEATRGKLQNVENKLTKVHEDVTSLTHGSCKQIWKGQSNKGNDVYQIIIGNNQHINVYCQMTSISGCQGGGWTLVMKIDGNLNTFKYDSSYWTNTNTYNDNSNGLNGGLDNEEYKGSTYWRTSLEEICVGMKFNENLRALSFSYSALSLHALISDGRYRQTHLGRNKWKSLISGSSLQRNCNREGFNAYHNNLKVRLGIFSNQENDCNTPDSYIGLGTHFSKNVGITAGNLAHCCSPDNGNKNLKVMGYILVR